MMEVPRVNHHRDQHTTMRSLSVLRGAGGGCGGRRRHNQTGVLVVLGSSPYRRPVRNLPTRFLIVVCCVLILIALLLDKNTGSQLVLTSPSCCDTGGSWWTMPAAEASSSTFRACCWISSRGIHHQHHQRYIKVTFLSADSVLFMHSPLPRKYQQLLSYSTLHQQSRQAQSPLRLLQLLHAQKKSSQSASSSSASSPSSSSTKKLVRSSNHPASGATGTSTSPGQRGKVQVKLLQHIAGVGQAGQIVMVAPAYYQNKLRPNKMAQIITNEQVQQELIQMQQEKEYQHQQAMDIQQAILSYCSTIRTMKKCGPDGQLFGGIGPKVILDLLQHETVLVQSSTNSNSNTTTATTSTSKISSSSSSSIDHHHEKDKDKNNHSIANNKTDGMSSSMESIWIQRRSTMKIISIKDDQGQLIKGDTIKHTGTFMISIQLLPDLAPIAFTLVVEPGR